MPCLVRFQVLLLLRGIGRLEIDRSRVELGGEQRPAVLVVGGSGSPGCRCVLLSRLPRRHPTRTVAFRSRLVREELVELRRDIGKIHRHVHRGLDLSEHLLGRLFEERGLIRRPTDRETHQLVEGRVGLARRRQVVELHAHQAGVEAPVLALEPALDLVVMEARAQGQHRLHRLDYRHRERTDSGDEGRDAAETARHR